LFLNEINFIQA